MPNPYSETIRRVIESLEVEGEVDEWHVVNVLCHLDTCLDEAFEEMKELHSEVLRLRDENEHIKREGYGRTNFT